METKQREQRSILAVNLGLGANILLAVLKTTVGVLGHSSALLADGINSTSDVAYYIIVRVFMGLACKPADDEHPYGHRQLESIAAMVVGAFVLTTAIVIFWDAVNKVYDLWVGQGDFNGVSLGALAVAVFTVGIKIALNFITRHIGRQTNNPAVLALAYDHRNDIFAASAVSLGIFLGRIGYTWVDPLAGALVAMVILRTGIEILRESSGDLMDTVPGKVLNQQVVQILTNNSHVRQVEEVFAHRFGPYWVINVTIGIDGLLSVLEGDRIATQAEQALLREIDLLQRVHIHYHPVQDTNRQV
ncbi:cation diffusion facilitator family transporter [bacterium]|nr:cation diffusion facilitator family transporter [bacterium]